MQFYNQEKLVMKTQKKNIDRVIIQSPGSNLNQFSAVNDFFCPLLNERERKCL